MSRGVVGAALLAFALAGGTTLLACTSAPSGGGGRDAADAAPDAPRDAAHDGGSGFPVTDDAGEDAADAGSACDRLRAQIDALGRLARACDPQGAQECIAAVDGLCCQITVSAASTQAVGDFQRAVSGFASKCGPPDCTKVLCELSPSGVCDGTGRVGTCR